MSSGAITLQCPECGGVFLTLQHGGQTEICPHCAVCGPRANFRKANEPSQPRVRTDLPAAKAETETGSSSSPAFAAAARSQVLDSPFPLAPESFFKAPREDDAPSAPHEAAPVTPADAPQQIADLPPLPDFKHPGHTNGNGHAHPEGAAANHSLKVDAPSEEALPIADFPPKDATPAVASAEASSPTSAPSPIWPGLDLDETPAQEEEAPAATQAAPAKPAEVPSEPVVTTPAASTTTVQPPRRSQRAWPRLALAAALALCAGWLFWQRNHSLVASAPAPIETPKPKPTPVVAQTKPQPTPVAAQTRPSPTPRPTAPPAVTSVPAAPIPAVSPPKTSSPATPPAASHKPPVVASASSIPHPAPPQPTAPPQQPKVAEMTRPAEPVHSAPTPTVAPVKEASLPESATLVMKAFDAARTTKDRLALIADPDKHRTQLEDFFKAHREPLEANPPEASAGSVVLLPGGQETKLFRVITKPCPEGALLYFHQTDGKTLLDWPLFSQSHEHHYDQFVTATNASKAAPQWFTVLSRRTHASALKGPAKEQWIALDAQGSLAASGAAVVYVDKDSPAGRYAESTLKWDKIYLTGVQLGKKVIEGQSLNVVLNWGGLRDPTSGEVKKK